MFASIAAWFRNSLTIFWARVLMFVGVAVQVVVVFGSIPQVHEIMGLLFGPSTAALSIAAVGLVTEIVRRRTAPRVTYPAEDPPRV